MGFFTRCGCQVKQRGFGTWVAIPFRVGWGFSRNLIGFLCPECAKVAIPFRVGWGFSKRYPVVRELKEIGRNPFQGGMGFFTIYFRVEETGIVPLGSQSLSGWDGVFHLVSRLSILGGDT